MLTGWELFAAILLPAAASASLAMVGWRLAHHQYSARTSRSWAGPLAVGTGFIAGWLALFGWTGLPPHDAVDWLLPLALPLVAIATCDALGWVPPPARAVAIAISVVACLLLIAWPVLVGGRDSSLPWQLVAAIGLAVVSMISLDVLATTISAGRLAALLTATTVPAAIVLGCSGSARLGLAGLLLASSLAGLLVANLALGSAGRGRGVTLVAGTLLAGLLWSSRLYATLRVLDAVLLAVAPCLAWIGLCTTRRFGRLSHLAIQVGIVLIVAGVAAACCWLDFRESGL